MTSTELVPLTATTGLPEKIEYATQLAKSDLLPKQYRDNPANILLVMEFGEYLGIPPVAALRLIHIIDNKPVASAELISGRVRMAGHRLRVTYDPDKKAATCSIWRSDDPDFEFRAQWTWDHANAVRDKNGQPLTAKANWRNYYPAMLKWRAVTECARDACPEILLGVSYTAEELGTQELADDEADQLGVMTRHQRVEHAELRRSVKDDRPRLAERVHEADPDDPWTEPLAGQRSQRMAALQELFAFSDDELGDLLTWLAPGDVTPAGTRILVSFLDDHLLATEGDVEEARSRIWSQYHEANPQAGDGDGA